MKGLSERQEGIGGIGIFYRVFVIGLMMIGCLAIGINRQWVADRFKLMSQGKVLRNLTSQVVGGKEYLTSLVNKVWQKPVEKVNYWEMEESELNYRRVIYNVVTKPGLRKIWFNGAAMFLVVMGLGIGSIWKHSKQKKKRGGISRKKNDRDIKAGTLEVRKRSGVIYSQA